MSNVEKYFLIGILLFSLLLSGCTKEAPQGQTPGLTGEIPEQPTVETPLQEPLQNPEVPQSQKIASWLAKKAK